MANLRARAGAANLQRGARIGAAPLAAAAALSRSSSSSSGPAGAASAGASSADGGSSNLADVTFHRDVEPILQRSCQGCHVPGGIARFPLITYQDAQAQAVEMVGDTALRIMPPWHAQNTDE